MMNDNNSNNNNNNNKEEEEEEKENEKRYSNDSGCESTSDKVETTTTTTTTPETFMFLTTTTTTTIKNDNESVYSSNSVATTATTTNNSSISSSNRKKSPNAVFISVKQFLTSASSSSTCSSSSKTNNNNKQCIYPDHNNNTNNNNSNNNQDSLTSRFKRHAPSTISFGSLFTRKQQPPLLDDNHSNSNHSNNNSVFSISPPSTTPATFSYSSTATTTNNEENHRGSAWHRSKRRSSVVDLASRFLNSNNKREEIHRLHFQKEQDEEEQESEDETRDHVFKFDAGHQQQQEKQLEIQIQAHQEEDSVGTLLFGKDVDHLDFLQQEKLDSKSVLSQDKKTREYQEKDKIRHLTDTINNSNNLVAGLPLFKGLVTATLTTLHSRLLNECEETLNHVVKMPNEFPSDRLESIMFDLHKLTDMIKYNDGETLNIKGGSQNAVLNNQVKSIELSIEQGKEGTNSHLQENIILVKDIISKIKHVINICVSQYYKIAEMAMVIPTKGYTIEGHNSYGTLYRLDFFHELEHQHDEIKKDCVDHKDNEAHWFRSYFMGDNVVDMVENDVFTFFGNDELNQPVLISAMTQIENGNKQHRIICRTKKNTTRELVNDSFLLNPPSKHEEQTETAWKNIIETTLNIPFHQLRYIPGEILKSSGIYQDILRLDESTLCFHHKFGVLLVKEGQTKEEEWFSNQHDSKLFDDFLNIIGRRVELKGYTGWTGGLDTRSGDSGEYTFVNEWNQAPIAYHVSTLIPSKPGDKQQIQRKRHIGNDIVCIIFVEGRQPFNPSAIKSQFLHVFIIVHPEKWNDKDIWRVETVRVEDVPEFGPALPEIAIFDSKEKLSDFLLAKLVNAEYAALKSPKFTMPMARAREGFINSIIERGENKITQHNTTSKHCKSPSSSSSTISSKSLKLGGHKSATNVIDHGHSTPNDMSSRKNDIPMETSSSNNNHKKINYNSTDKRGFNARRSQSDFDLVHMTLDVKQNNGSSFRMRAQSILTAIPGFHVGYGRSSSSLGQHADESI